MEYVQEDIYQIDEDTKGSEHVLIWPDLPLL